MKTIITLVGIILLSLLGSTTASARGMLPPPPPFIGGNVGDWLGSGPMFGSDHPWGKDFPDEWGGGGAYDGGGDGGLNPYNPSGGSRRSAGADQDTIGINFGCNRCQKPTYVNGNCEDICNCKRQWHDPPYNNVTRGYCTFGAILIEANRCGFNGGACWHYIK